MTIPIPEIWVPNKDKLMAKARELVKQADESRMIADYPLKSITFTWYVELQEWDMSFHPSSSAWYRSQKCDTFIAEMTNILANFRISQSLVFWQTFAKYKDEWVWYTGSGGGITLELNPHDRAVEVYNCLPEALKNKIDNPREFIGHMEAHFEHEDSKGQMGISDADKLMRQGKVGRNQPTVTHGCISEGRGLLRPKMWVGIDDPEELKHMEDESESTDAWSREVIGTWMDEIDHTGNLLMTKPYPVIYRKVKEIDDNPTIAHVPDCASMLHPSRREELIEVMRNEPPGVSAEPSFTHNEELIYPHQITLMCITEGRHQDIEEYKRRVKACVDEFMDSRAAMDANELDAYMKSIKQAHRVTTEHISIDSYNEMFDSNVTGDKYSISLGVQIDPESNMATLYVPRPEPKE